MSLEDVLAHVREREKMLTVYAPDEEQVSAVRRGFARRNLAVDYVPVPADEPARVELTDGDRVCETLPLAALEPLVASDEQACQRVEDDPPYASLLRHVDEATFVLDERRRQRRASREVEDRAWRGGEGRLVAGFESAAAFDARRDAYRLLGEVLDVHVHVAESGSDPPDDVAVHPHDGVAESDYRFVAYDGGDDETQRSAFLATARDDGESSGILTYEPALVETVFETLGVPHRTPP